MRLSTVAPYRDKCRKAYLPVSFTPIPVVVMVSLGTISISGGFRNQWISSVASDIDVTNEHEEWT